MRPSILSRSLAFLIVVSLLLPALPVAAQEPTTAPPAPVALRVTSTAPSDGAADVGIDGTVVVSFNRPVVPLVGADAQDGLPSPLQFDPPVEGKGQWLSTSIYAFEPQPGLAGATEYVVTVPAMASTVNPNERMEGDYTFSFTTASPLVTDVQPQGQKIAPETAVRVVFSQPMDKPSTEDAFGLFLAGSDLVISGETAWNEASTSLTFTPTEPLPFGESFTIHVGETAQPVSKQGTLREGVDKDFTVVPLPDITVTTPSDGSTEFSPERQVRIQFASPMSRTTLMDAISVAPMLTSTVVYSYYNEWESQLVIEWAKLPNTEYTVTIGGEAQDLYGNTLGQTIGGDFSLTFTTGDYPPFVRVDLEQFTHFSPSDKTYISLFYRNMPELEMSLSTLPPGAFINEFSGDAAWDLFTGGRAVSDQGDLIWTRTYTAEESANETYQRIITLNDGEDETAGATLAPGLYLLEVDLPQLPVNPDTGMQPNAKSVHVIAISDHNIVVKKSNAGDSLAWVTDLASGEPLPDQEVVFHSPGYGLGEYVTDSDGIARGNVSFPNEMPWLPLIAMVGAPGDAEFAVGSSAWNTGIATWDFNVNGGYALEPVQSFFYTDRPIYRPGQTVHWKGIVRRFVDDQYVIPEPTQPISITIRDDRGNTLWSRSLPLSDMGTLDGSLDLAADATTGFYFLEAVVPTGGTNQWYGGIGFQVATYEKPEFAIALTPDQEEYTAGDTIRMTVQADYFSGGALANAPLTWRVIADPYSFRWEEQPAGRWFSFDPFDPESERYDPYQGAFLYGLIKEGAGETGADGSFTLELPADLGSSLMSQRWLFDVTVQSPTSQFVNAQKAVPVHRGEFYVGISPREYVATVGAPVTIDVAAVKPDGSTVDGVGIEVGVYEFRWNSVQEKTANGTYVWQTSYERVPVFSDQVTSGADGLAAFDWTPERAGQYQIVAQAEDAAGNAISSAGFLWVASSDPSQQTAWRRENNDRIPLVADQLVYEPGDTARILVPSPFAGAVTALVTIERSGVDEARVLKLEGSSETIEVPITADMIPNAFVSVVLIKGVDDGNPTPAMRVGLAQLEVDVAEKVLSIETTTERAPGADGPVRPGETVTYTLAVADAAGEPVADAEVSVAIVDKALLTLAQNFNATLVDTFYRLRPLGITTGATLNINRDRMSQQLSEGAKGGGGGGGEGMFEVREEFPDTALWEAMLVSDERGLIMFALTLPDNLTTWEMSAVAVTGDTRVGEATHDLVVSKELQVRPILPRFFTAGDRATIGALILNTTELPAEDGSFTFQIEGAETEGETDVAFDLSANGSTIVSLPIYVTGETDAVAVTMSAETKSLNDAVRLVLPVLQYQSPETIATSGDVGPEGVTEQVIVPDEATEDGALTVRMEPGLAAGMIPALTYLENFPWECTEQTVSRFLPNLATARSIFLLGVENQGLAGDLDTQVTIGVQTLVNRQNADGGWGTWPGEESRIYVSSYSLWGLAQAKAAGYTVPDSTIERAVGYLNRKFVAPDLAQEDWILNRMAFMHYVLAGLGEGDPGRMSTLYDVRERMQNYGKAWLALAMSEIDPGDARIQTLLDDLEGAAVMSATGASWQEPEVDFGTLNTDLRSTAIILYTFTKLRPDASILPNTVRWLMVQREQREGYAGIWSNTQENAWSILALTEWMLLTNELEGNYDWETHLNGNVLGSGEVRGPATLDTVTLRADVADLLRGEANTLDFARTDGPGALYYTAALQYHLDAAGIEPRDQGIVVDRQFYRNGAPVTSAQVGDLISVTVTIVAPVDLTQLRVEVPIPAGTEIVDLNLADQPLYDEFGNPIQRWEPAAWMPTFRDVRDDRVALFDSVTPAGTHQYSFMVRATLPGEYRVLPAFGEMMYFTEVWGRSGGANFTVTN